MARRKAVKTKQQRPKKAARHHHVPSPAPAQTFRARVPHRQTWLEELADFMTRFFGTVTFLVVNLIFFKLWVIWNLGLIPGVGIFDPYPFGMLTMVVSLEAICLSIIVLISQNRAAKMADLREEVDFQIDLQSEKQISAIMRSLDKILHHLQISHHEESTSMKAIDLDQLERRVRAEIDTD
jgi:uncharacterized membrane protein